MIIAKPKGDIGSAFVADAPTRPAPYFAPLMMQELMDILGSKSITTLKGLRDFYDTPNGDFGCFVRTLLTEAVEQRLRWRRGDYTEAERREIAEQEARQID